MMLSRTTHSTFLVAGRYAMVTFLSIHLIDVHATSCVQRSCHGDVGNLANGRAVSHSNACDRDDNFDSTRYCRFEDDNCGEPKCSRCGENHRASHMLDSRRRTYWQSKLLKSDDERVTITLDLETTFYFTHFIMVFTTPQPGAMVLERSVDFGKTWQTYQRFANDCRKTFGVHASAQNHRHGCTESYSTEQPCSGGEVIYRVLNPTNSTNDPYSAESKYLLNVTNIRIQMWKPQVCSKCNVSAKDLASLRHFAVYDLIIRGTCFCNGHADSCVALKKELPATEQSHQAMVHGKCLCEHNTEGNHCDKCLPLYNDAPWRPGNGFTGQPNPCQRCECNGHSESCRFDRRIWSLTEQTSGGICENCKHNTTGRRCDRCKTYYFRRTRSRLTDPDVCEECNCHANGTIAIDSSDDFGNLIRVTMPCDSTSGQCACRFGVSGRRCDRCQRGFWGISHYGCQKCLCRSGVCNQISGQCQPDYDDDLTLPLLYQQSIPDQQPRFPDESIDFSLFESLDYDRSEKMAASWRRRDSCICKEKEIRNAQEFCTKDYGYAIKVKVLGAEDNGATTLVSVAVRRVIKQGRVQIRKGKMHIYPESWTTTGCTCPALIPGNDYIVVGHENWETNRLVVNMDSVVKRWNRKKHRNRIINRIRRSRCH